MRAETACRACGAISTASAQEYAPTVAATYGLAQLMLAEILPDPPDVVERRRSALLSEVYGVQDPELPRRVLVGGIWRWPAR